MRTFDFIKEKFLLFLAAVIVYLIMLCFLLITNVQIEIVLVITFLFWSYTLGSFIVEYMRRKNTYDEWMLTLERLDQKYLLGECIEEPNFLDGKILYDILQDCDKSMLDHVNEYKHRQLDYKEYIEMWVHEIKTPLAASKLILENNPNAVRDSLMEEVNKVEDYVEQALFYARSSTLEKDYIIKKFTLEEMVNKVIRKHSKIFILRGIGLKLDNLELNVYTDNKWVEFILDQIIVNALKYCDAKQPQIEICACKYANSVLLEIKDNGSGVEENEIGRVFDRGFTGSRGRKQEASTGLGLYLSKQLCNKLNLGLNFRMSGSQTIVGITFPMNTYNLAE